MLQGCLSEGTQLLKEAGVPEPKLSAEFLLGLVLKKKRVQLHLEREQQLTDLERKLFFLLLKKRAERYPLQYLLGTVSFRGHELHVGEGCLIPRPETELLVEAVLNRMGRRDQPLHLLDIGTGSGNIAVSLALESIDWHLTATDFSEDALRFARINAEMNQVHERIHFVHSDLFEGLDQKFAALVSNPPYLTTCELDSLQKEVAHEPHMALDGGEDGLSFYRRIIRLADQVLKPGGLIFFEIGIGQAESVSAELQANGFSEIKIVKDYSGIDRIISGRFK